MDWSRTGSQTIRSSQDSAIGNCKSSFPFQDSQSSGLSQVATQDVFSQNIATPQSENEVNKPSSVYEKWKSRQMMMKRDNSMPHSVAVGPAGGIPGSAMKTSLCGMTRWDSRSSINSLGSHAGALNYRGKPADLDERKLMDQMVCAVKDCNNEVKSMLFGLMEHMNRTDISNGQLANSMSSFLESIKNCEASMKKLSEEQGTPNSALSELEVRLSKKDTQISSLEKQLAEARNDEIQKYTEAIKDEIQFFQSTFMDKFKQLEVFMKENEQGKNNLLVDCCNNVYIQQKQNEASFKFVTNGMRESEKRISADMLKFLQKSESKTLSQNKECTKKVESLLQDHTRDIQQIITSDSSQRQDLNDWCATLESTMRKGLTDMLYSLEHIIKREINSMKENSCEKMKKNKSVGTITENGLVHQRNIHSGCQIRKLEMPSSNHSLDKSCGSQNKTNCIRAISMQQMRFISQMSNENVQPDSNSISQPFGSVMGSSLVQDHKNSLQRELEIGRSASSFQQSLYSHCIGPRNRTDLSKNRSPQDSVPYGVRSFVSPFKTTEHAFSGEKGPSPCAVVVPQRQALNDQRYSDQDTEEDYQMSPNIPKTKNRKRKKCVYTKKKKGSGKEKCAIEGLSTNTESIVRMEKKKPYRASKIIPCSMQSKTTPQNAHYQTFHSSNSSVRYQRFKTQPHGGINNSKVKGNIDPYSFDEADPQNTPTKPVVRKYEQASFSRPQTRSYVGLTAAKKNNLCTAQEVNESPPSSPALSMMSLKKSRTPFKGFNCGGGLRGSSFDRPQNMKWQTKVDLSTPKTLLSDM